MKLVHSIRYILGYIAAIYQEMDTHLPYSDNKPRIIFVSFFSTKYLTPDEMYSLRGELEKLAIITNSLQKIIKSNSMIPMSYYWSQFSLCFTISLASGSLKLAVGIWRNPVLAVASFAPTWIGRSGSWIFRRGKPCCRWRSWTLMEHPSCYGSMKKLGIMIFFWLIEVRHMPDLGRFSGNFGNLRKVVKNWRSFHFWSGKY